MTYIPPSIGPAGLTIPSFLDILNYYTTNYQNIYGQQVSLDNSNADIQLINILALALSDAENCIQLAYNNFAPLFAVGGAQDNLYKLNGLVRQSATNSTCLVTLTGTSGTVITNGVVQDVNGNLWNLPTPVTIGGGGTVTVTAVAQAVGAVSVGASQIINIFTPTAGWTGVTNGSNLPVVGTPVEADSQFRARQSVSTELPSISLYAGTIAGILAVPGVTRLQSDENVTAATNGNGTPGHSIQMVVEGGTNLAIATAIYNNKSLGCGTSNTNANLQTVAVTDPITGIVTNISFNRPTDEQIYVVLGVHQLPGYTSAITPLIQSAVLAYLNGLEIGQNVSFISTLAAAMGAAGNLDKPLFLIEVASSGIGTSPSPSGTTDIVIPFGTVAIPAASNPVVVNFV